MSVKELVADLQKSDSPERTLDVLRALEAAPVTIKDLQELKVGAIVNKLRKHDDGDVATTAKGLVKKWKGLAQFKTQVPEFRQASRKKLLEVLETYDVAEAVEARVNEQFPEKSAYVAKLRSLTFNLKKNDGLRASLVDKRVSAERLVSMTVEELATKEIREEREKMRAFQHDARSLDWDRKNRDRINKSIGIDESKGMFTCKRCKSKRISNYEKQTRSADEPMTQFFECLDCGARWRT